MMNENYRIEVKRIVRRGKTYLRKRSTKRGSRVMIRQGLKCCRCGHVWVPRRKPGKPLDDVVACPKCNSELWDIPRSDTPRKSHRRAV